MLNDEQRKIVFSTEPYILVDAGPGTGKTRTLMEAAEVAIKKNNSKVVIVTFTRSAAEEMKNRMKSEPYFIGTIHSFSLHELEKLAIKYNFRIRLLKKKQVLDILMKILSKTNQEYLLDELYSFIFNKEETENTKTLLKLQQKYNEFKRTNQLFDFTDTPLYLLQKLEELQIKLNFTNMYIDEAQDLDEIQYKLLDQIDSNKMVIGDPKQSIYTFRGAAPQVFYRFLQKGFKLMTLNISYRCYQEVLDYVGSNLISNKGYSKEIISKKAYFNDPVFLCRTNKEVKELEKLEVKAFTIHASKGLEFESVVVANFPFKEEDDKNLFYVACTRTKNYLFLENLDKIKQNILKNRKSGF